MVICVTLVDKERGMIDRVSGGNVWLICDGGTRGGGGGRHYHIPYTLYPILYTLYSIPYTS